MGIDSLNDGLNFIKEHPIGTAVGAAGIGVAAGLGAAAIVGAVKSRKTKRHKNRSVRKRSHRIKHTARGWKQDRRRRSRQKWEITYQRRKNKKMKKRRGKIYYARKTGQPYIILSNGRAKFIKGKRRK